MALTIGNTDTQRAVSLPAAPPQSAGTAQSAVKPPVTLPEPALQQPRPEQVQEAVKAMKQLIETKAPNSLSFSIDDSTGKTVVKILDAETGELIRQIPPKEMLEITRSLEKNQGMLLQQQA